MVKTDWLRLLGYVTGLVNQELLLKNEYLVAENLILRAQIKGRLLLSDDEKATLAEIAKGLGRGLGSNGTVNRLKAAASYQVRSSEPSSWASDSEKRREVSQTTQTAWFPSDAMRAGNFSALLNPLVRAPITIYDQLIGTPFPGNVIPTSRLNAGSLNLLQYMPHTKFLQLQVRLEAINAFNTPFFGTPNGISFATNNSIKPDGSLMGEIRSLATPMRTVQVGMKLQW